LRYGAWVNATYDEIYSWVKYIYMPLVQKSSEGKPTVIDLGHHNLYFYDQLVDYLKAETNFSFAFVRIRRERLEHALSLRFSAPGKPMRDLCKELWFRFCPFDPHMRAQEVVNNVSSKVFNNEFTNFQRALWIIDETEARWQRLVKEHPDMPTLELLWGKVWPQSITLSMMDIASQTLFSLDPSKDVVNASQAKSHTQHFGNGQLDMYNFAKQDAAYRKLMRHI
jgi:hypothetical protein